MDYSQHTPKELVGLLCTLRGVPAILAGSKYDYATVITIDGLCRAEYSWDAVRRIMTKGGNFQ